MEHRAYSTVDPKYNHWLALVELLTKLNVITVIGTKRHVFSAFNTTTINNIQPKPHWIPAAIVSLSVEYFELEFGPSKRSK